MINCKLIFNISVYRITFYIIFIRTENNTAFIIIDSDGGVDDIFAIRMLMGAENVIIKAVTTVNGITGIINATRNVKTLMTISRTKQVYLFLYFIVFNKKIIFGSIFFRQLSRYKTAHKCQCCSSLERFNAALKCQCRISLY